MDDLRAGLVAAGRAVSCVYSVASIAGACCAPAVGAFAAQAAGVTRKEPGNAID